MTLNQHVACNVARMTAPPTPVAPDDDVRLIEERAWDFSAREELLDAAFGPSRFAKTCERLREGRKPAQHLAFSAMDGDDLVGTLRFWHVEAGGVAALMLGPLAVADSHRSLGVGGDLMRFGLRRARMIGHRAVILVGDEPYYRRFGFTRGPVRRLALPGPVESERFLGLEFVEGALEGACGLVAPTGAPLPAARAA